MLHAQRRTAIVLVQLSWLLQLSAAHAADPTTADCLAANEKSIALRKQHALRAARAELLICAAANCPEDIRNECARRVDQVNAQMPTIVFDAKDPHGNDLSAVAVSMDGQDLVGRLEGTALSIDPGEHVFVFSTQGAPSVEKRWIIREGEKGRRERIVLGDPPLPAAGPAPLPAPVPVTEPIAPAPVSQPVAAVDSAPPARSSHATQRTIGLIVGAVGIGSLGFALFERIQAGSKYSDSERAAQSLDIDVSRTTRSKYDDAKSAQTLSIVFAAVGVAALGTGLYLFLSGLDSEPAQASASRSRLVPSVGPSGAAVSYVGAF
jgi:hypothetical protein